MLQTLIRSALKRHMSEKLRGGLEQQIERFLKEHPGTALIVIDTLQRIRGIANDVNPYASDYRDLGILKELADKHRIAILLIHHLRKMNDDDPMNMDMLIAARTDKKKQETERCKRELKAVDKRIGELSKILTKLYEDAALERISEERYQAMAPGYEREQELLKGQREKLVAEITRCEKIYDDIEKFLPIIWKYTDITELDAHILNELIEKIVVYEKTINPDGSKSQRVDIHYKFIGYVNQKEWFGTMPQPPAPSGTEHNAQDKQTA